MNGPKNQYALCGGRELCKRSELNDKKKKKKKNDDIKPHAIMASFPSNIASHEFYVNNADVPMQSATPRP